MVAFLTDRQKPPWIAGLSDRAAPTYGVAGRGHHDRFGERLVALAGVGPGDSLRGVLEQLAPERLEQYRREASEHIAAMGPDLGLRLEALVAVGRKPEEQ